MSYSRPAGSSSPRRSTGVASFRAGNRPRSSNFYSGTGNGYSGLSGGYGGGNSLGHSYGSNSLSSYGGYHSPSFSNYGGSYSTYGGTSSGYGSLHLPSSPGTSGCSSSYLSSSPSSSFKHLSPGGYTKSISRSPTRSNMGSRTGSTSSLMSLKSEGSEGYVSDDKSERSSRLGSVSSTGINEDSCRLQGSANSTGGGVTENGEIDYKKLYEESRAQNERLKEKLKKTEDELADARSNLQKHVNMDKSSLSEAEKRERRALERKLSEMEEELKQLQKLKAENERLKAENRALTRVISKLTNSSQK